MRADMLDPQYPPPNKYAVGDHLPPTAGGGVSPLQKSPDRGPVAWQLSLPADGSALVQIARAGSLRPAASCWAKRRVGHNYRIARALGSRFGHSSAFARVPTPFRSFG